MCTYFSTPSPGGLTQDLILLSRDVRMGPVESTIGGTMVTSVQGPVQDPVHIPLTFVDSKPQNY